MSNTITIRHTDGRARVCRVVGTESSLHVRTSALQTRIRIAWPTAGTYLVVPATGRVEKLPGWRADPADCKAILAARGKGDDDDSRYAIDLAKEARHA